MDVLSSAQRSYNMSRIRGKDTAPEMIVRRLVHAMGFRYRLHDASIPGKPDLVFRSRRKAIFIHGCYWHRHDCPNGKIIPATNMEFWLRKFEKNVKRDTKVHYELESNGWKTLTIWECDIYNNKIDCIAKKIMEFLIS